MLLAGRQRQEMTLSHFALAVALFGHLLAPNQKRSNVFFSA